MLSCHISWANTREALNLSGRYRKRFTVACPGAKFLSGVSILTLASRSSVGAVAWSKMTPRVLSRS
jgi:hypothetical protein